MLAQKTFSKLRGFLGSDFLNKKMNFRGLNPLINPT